MNININLEIGKKIKKEGGWLRVIYVYSLFIS